MEIQIIWIPFGLPIILIREKKQQNYLIKFLIQLIKFLIQYQRNHELPAQFIKNINPYTSIQSRPPTGRL